jgi:hypothetical protein
VAVIMCGVCNQQMVPVVSDVKAAKYHASVRDSVCEPCQRVATWEAQAYMSKDDDGRLWWPDNAGVDQIRRLMYAGSAPPPED